VWGNATLPVEIARQCCIKSVEKCSGSAKMSSTVAASSRLWMPSQCWAAGEDPMMLKSVGEKSTCKQTVMLVVLRSLDAPETSEESSDPSTPARVAKRRWRPLPPAVPSAPIQGERSPSARWRPSVAASAVDASAAASVAKAVQAHQGGGRHRQP